MIKNNICKKTPLEKLKLSKRQSNISNINHINTVRYNNNNILIIAKLKLFESQNSSNRLNFLKFLNTKNNIKVIEDSNEYINDWIIRNNWKPDIIIYYFLSHNSSWLDVKIKNLANINITKYMIFEDCIYTTIIKNMYNKYNFSKVLIPTYNDDIINYLKQNFINYNLFGYYIDTNIFKKLNNIEKKYDLLYYGAHFLPVYPLRDRIYKVLKKLEINNKYKIKIIEHLSYNKNIFKLPIDDDLALLINESRFCIATSSKFMLFLKKYIEIPLCGTTIIGNIPNNYISDLSNNMVNIDFDANENEIEKIIIDALENKYTNEEKNTLLLENYMKSNYSFHSGYNKLCNICNCIITYKMKDFIEKNKITHLYTSYSLNIFEKRFLDKFNLIKYDNNIDKNTIFFGFYCTTDIDIINNHLSNSYCMFGGTDVDMKSFKYISKKTTYLSISKNIFNRLKNINIISLLIDDFNLVDTNIFKKIKERGPKIYIYSGNSKNFGERYGEKYYKEVVKLLPNYEYIYSHTNSYPYEKMPEIYSQCFIGLRLTNKDGNANTVQEFEALGIPIVHNQSEYGLKWKNVNDIIKHINSNKVHINN